MIALALLINNECVNCGVCRPSCPNEAIRYGKEKHVIDWERCDECVGSFDGPQCINVCPVDCIEKDPEHEETKEQLRAKNQKL